MGDVAANPPNKAKENVVSLTCPMLTATNYTTWSMRMKAILNVHGAWSQVDPGTAIDAKKNSLAIALLFQSLPEEQLIQVGNLNTAKEMWDAIKLRNLGADRVREARLQTLMSEFESLKMKDPSTIDEFTTKIAAVVSKAAGLGSVIEEQKIVKRFLNGLSKRFIHMVASIEQVVNLKTITFDDVVGRLKAYEERMRDEEVQSDSQGKLMFHKVDNPNRSGATEFALIEEMQVEV